jgi:hypothetical protein
MTQRYPVPPPPGSYTPANVPVISYFGGDIGDDVAVSTANATNDYMPRHQTDKAATLGVPMVTDVGRARGVLEPDDPYPKAGDTPLAAPVITSMSPNTAASGTGPDMIVTITGTGFTAWSTVTSGNFPIPCFYVSPTTLEILQKPKASVAGTVQVVVTDHGVASAPSDFIFT